MVQVVVTQGINALNTVKESMNKLGGIKQFIQNNSIVFIKPDLTLPLGPPITIQPQVLGYIVKECRDAGAKEIYIGFNPLDGVSSKQVLKLLGLDYYLKKLGVTLLDLENEIFSSVKIPNPIFFDNILVPEKLLQSELFISIIAPRTDIFGNLALGLKNYFDLLNDKQKQELIRTGSIEGLLDFYKVVPTQLAIWDAMTLGEGPSPFKQTAVPNNLILASTNLIAGDSITSQMMGFAPLQVDILKSAMNNQLGTINPEEITIVGENIQDHCKNIKKPIISIENKFDSFEIVKGKPCAGCQICLSYFIDFIFQFIEKDLKDFGGFTCFIGELSQNTKYSLKTGVILFGDCAISSNLPITFNNKTQKKKFFFKIPGCPPLNLRTIEKFCLNFKEWLPSLQIIEELIRKWTIGRRYKTYHLSPKIKDQERIDHVK